MNNFMPITAGTLVRIVITSWKVPHYTNHTHKDFYFLSDREYWVSEGRHSVFTNTGGYPTNEPLLKFSIICFTMFCKTRYKVTKDLQDTISYCYVKLLEKGGNHERFYIIYAVGRSYVYLRHSSLLRKFYWGILVFSNSRLRFRSVWNL